MGVNIQVLGVEGLQDKLNKLSNHLQRKIVKQALEKSAKIVLAAIKSKAPYSPEAPHHREKLSIKPFKGRKGNFGYKVETGTREELGIKKDAKGYYPTALEFGSRHMAAKPHMRPALAEQETRIINHIIKDIQAAIAAQEDKDI